MKLFPHFIAATATIFFDTTSASTFLSPREKMESQLQLSSLMKEKASTDILSATTTNSKNNKSNKNNLRYQFKEDHPRSWDQVYQDIQPVGMNGDGDDFVMNFGWSVVMSDDAQTVAIGSPITYSSNLEERFRGIVQVFEDGFPHGWTKKGSDITGTDDYDFIGYSLDMSAGGDAIVINSPLSGNFTGLVQVYKYASDWEQLGSDITGDGELSYFGFGFSSVAHLSADAQTLIVGSPLANNFTGIVHKFSLGPLTSSWNLDAIYQGESPYNMFGYTLDATSDASTIIIGAPGYDGGRGLVQAYQGSSLVSSVTGYNELDFMGTSISLSEDASTVVILSPGFDNEKGLMQVYKNEEVVGSATGDNYDGSIESVKVSKDASTVAVSTTEYVQVFKYSSSYSWEQAGGNLMFYHDAESKSGGVPPVALSEDGNTILQGYPEGTISNPDEAGFARVHTLSESSFPTPVPTMGPTQAPIKASTSTDTDTFEEDDDDCGYRSIFSNLREFLKN